MRLASKKIRDLQCYICRAVNLERDAHKNQTSKDKWKCEAQELQDKFRHLHFFPCVEFYPHESQAVRPKTQRFVRAQPSGK